MFKLKDDYTLLDIMLDDAKAQSGLYNPGPYWLNKTKVAANHIRKFGIGDFRGSSSLIGLSFSDSIFVDTRKTYDQTLIHKALKYVLENIFPINKAFDSQVNLTKSYIEQMLVYKRESIKDNQRTMQILAKYKLPHSLLGGCTDYVKIDENKISSHYLNLLEQLDHVVENVKLTNATTYFEIGGGFGVNTHLLLENFKNIKKVIYLDIPPNLYTGTQYLKAFYGDAVKDYSKTRSLSEIRFKNDDDLEIFAIAPWQIERINTEVDVFWNSHSFVEMPEQIVSNYSKFIKKYLNNNDSSIVLISYDKFDLNTTFDPDQLPAFFDNREFVKSYFPSLLNKERTNVYYIS